MKKPSQSVVPLPKPTVAHIGVWPAIFAVLFGAVLGLSMIKFGNPSILDAMVSQGDKGLARTDPGFFANPEFLKQDANAQSWWDAVLEPWPMIWGIAMLAVVATIGIKVGHSQQTRPRWLPWLLWVWFAWQFVSATGTVDPLLTKATLTHFAGCMMCFCLGLYVLDRSPALWFFWPGLLLGLLLVLWQGFAQHYGGLEAVRNYFYEQPNWRQFSTEAIKRFTSGRIFGTLVYPNALAGLILLLLPPLSVALWNLTFKVGRLPRQVILGLWLYMALACLYWSGSKAGWLIALLAGLIALLHLPLSRTLRVSVIGGVLVLGLAGFFVRYATYFHRGATSVSARFDYWRAATKTAVENPVLGTGPGTFSVPYKRIKAPTAEMARLVHNDYFEQASDSGVVGFLAYTGFIGLSLAFLYRYCFPSRDPLIFGAWLGLLAWTFQAFFEFGLYIPAIAWPAFTLLGWLLGTASQKQSTSQA